MIWDLNPHPIRICLPQSSRDQASPSRAELRKQSCCDPASDKPALGISIQSKGLLAVSGNQKHWRGEHCLVPNFQPTALLNNYTTYHGPTTLQPANHPTDLLAYLVSDKTTTCLPNCPTYYHTLTRTSCQCNCKTTPRHLHIPRCTYARMPTHPTAPRKTCNVPHISDCGHCTNTDCFHQTTRQQSCRGAPGRAWPPKGCKRTES